MKLAFLLGLLLATTAISFGQVEKAKTAEKAPQKQDVKINVTSETDLKKKEQRLKIVKNEKGMETKFDTTFNFNDEKACMAKVDSIMKSLEKSGIMSGEHKVIILRGGDQAKHMVHSGDNQFEVFYNTNDSGKVRHARRVIRMENGDIVTDNIEGGMIPPPPPVPPMPPMAPGHMKVMMLGGGDPYAHDPNNEDIVSYEKKDIGKGLEKITIVRKKHETPEPKKDVEYKVELKEDKK